MRNGSRKQGAASTRSGAGRAAAPAGIVAKRSSQVRARVGAWRASLARQTKEHPGRTAALALGAGFLLGGGLFSPLTARILGTGIRLALRMVVVPLITQSIVTLGEGLLTSGAGPTDDDQEHASAHSGSTGSRSENGNNQKHSASKDT